MMKSIKAPKLTFTDKLGSAVFSNVPVSVDAESGITSANFDENVHEFALAGDVIQKLNRALAREWLIDAIEAKRTEIAHDELHGIQLLLGLKAVEFAELLGLSKSAVSRIYKGDLKVNKPTTRLAMLAALQELEEPGSGRNLLAGDAARIGQKLRKSSFVPNPRSKRPA
jgi:hypothetical protein